MIKDDTTKLKAENLWRGRPQDLVTTSGSGLDPDITLEADLFQIRVSKARNIPAIRCAIS